MQAGRSRIRRKIKIRKKRKSTSKTGSKRINDSVASCS
jgi:hypothetical protein